MNEADIPNSFLRHRKNPQEISEIISHPKDETDKIISFLESQLSPQPDLEKNDSDPSIASEDIRQRYGESGVIAYNLGHSGKTELKEKVKELFKRVGDLEKKNSDLDKELKKGSEERKADVSMLNRKVDGLLTWMGKPCLLTLMEC